MAKITQSVPKKTTIKRKPVSFPKAVSKKASTKKAAITGFAVSKAYGFKPNDSGILVPTQYLQPVPSTKLQEGFKKAKSEIKKMVREIADIMTEDYKISEIKLSASFNADGKFLGFGIGGATTITLKITPVK